MKLNSSSKLAEILSEYPWLKDRLPEINERFKLLHTPLANVMLKTATIADMSKRSGMDEAKLLETLATLIYEHSA